MSDIALDIQDSYDEGWEDGKRMVVQDIAYELPRFVTGINPSAKCPVCNHAIGYNVRCDLCVGAAEVMRR